MSVLADLRYSAKSLARTPGVTIALLRNAEVAANFILPLCQDTGTATIVGKKGQQVWTGGNDAEQLARGVYECYTKENLRYSQVAPLDMFKEANTGTNLPAQIDDRGSGRLLGLGAPGQPGQERGERARRKRGGKTHRLLLKVARRPSCPPARGRRNLACDHEEGCPG